MLKLITYNKTLTHLSSFDYLNELQSKELINKRFDFVVESLIERDDVGNKTFLLELQLEKRKLIKSGYDSLMVQDSFLDIVNTFL